MFKRFIKLVVEQSPRVLTLQYTTIQLGAFGCCAKHASLVVNFQQISYLTVSEQHEPYRLMLLTHCQITTIYKYMWY